MGHTKLTNTFVLCFLTGVLSTSVCAQPANGMSDNQKLAEFAKKDLQITVIKNPGNVLRADRGWRGSVTVNDELVVVRSQGKIIRAYVTSTGREGKETPDGIFLGFDRCNANHCSDIYKTEMDWALFLDEDYALHSTTEDAYCFLGKPASAGCMRMLRSDARELFEMVTGKRETPGRGVYNHQNNNAVGTRILPKDKTREFWSALSEEERKQIADLALKSRDRVNQAIVDFNRRGDIKDDEHEDTRQEPPVQARPSGGVWQRRHGR